jgi:predicted TIM-barrel fold metal-dependent hydrolase
VRVIDMWAPIVPSHEIVAHASENFPDAMLGYLRVFYGQEPSQESVRRTIGALGRDDAAILADLDEAGIERVLVTGFDEASTAGATFVSNESVAAFAERNPQRVLPFCGADVMRGAAAVREVRDWVGGRGFRGLSLRPFMIGLPPDDRHYYPFYETCVELGVPVSVHASANWTTGRVSELGHPRHFDRVACDFPELVLVLSHAGYPWVLESCLLAWKHPNLYLELAAHRPRYFVAPGAGWEPLLRFGRTTIRDKVLYGTGAFLLGRSSAELVSEMRGLPLPPEVLAQWLYDNAARAMGLAATEPREAPAPAGDPGPRGA